MKKIKLFYVLTLVIIGFLLAATMLRPVTSDAKYSEVQRRQLVQAEDKWILQFEIFNHEGKDTYYTVRSIVGEQPYIENIDIRDAGMFTYIQYLYPEKLKDKSISFEVWKAGEETPFDRVTYNLR